MFRNGSDVKSPKQFGFGITIKLALWTLFGTGLILAATLKYSDFFSSGIIISLVEKGAVNIVKSAALQFDDRLQSVQSSTESLAYAIEFGKWNEVSLLDLLESVVKENDDIYGATIAFEPHSFNSEMRLFAPYYCKTPGGIKLVQLGTPEYDYLNKDWYAVPRRTGKPHWSSPYFDEGGGDIRMVTYSRPLFRRKSPSSSMEIKGVVTADLSLERLSYDITEMFRNVAAYAFMVSNEGTFVASPDAGLLFRDTIQGLAVRSGSSSFELLAASINSEASGFRDAGAILSGIDSYCAFFTIPSTGWKLCALFSKSELFMASDDLQDKLTLIAVFGTILLIGVSYLVALSFTGPLMSLVTATKRIGEGDLDFQVPWTNRRDEIGALASAFDNMLKSIKDYIERLTRATMEKERIESELSIAADIQRSMLPAISPTLGERQDLDVCALMQPAREVGGDFYDFFFMDQDNVCIAIGDVSGKGVPAALFMSVTKYLVEATVSSEQKLDIALQQVNSLLLKNNESCMFVTIFVGVLNLKTGLLTYANCGHNPPLILAPGGIAKALGCATGPILGVLEKPQVLTETCQFEPGAIMLTFTDGVTEAFNLKDELFGDDRLIQAVSSTADASVSGVVNQVMKSLRVFCGDCPQTDDITMLAMKFKPKQKT